MKKRKTYEISVIDKTYSKTISDETKFYTSDTALELGFELKETEYTFESAEIVLLNIDDRSLVTRPVSKVNNDFVYELDDDIIPHYGEWHGQLRFESGETYVSSPVKFRIENDLSNDRPPQLSDVQSWVSLKRYADGLVEELKQAVLSVEGIEGTFNTNELERQTTFETNESERDETFSANETARQAQELEREGAEATRQSVFDDNESNRTETFNANEAARQENETARIEAEKQRNETVENIEDRQSSVENQFISVQQEMTDKDVISAPEIIAARNGEADLKSRLDKEHHEVTARLAQKVGMGKKAELEDLSGNVLSAIEGGEGTSFNLLSIPQDYSVTPEKTTFITISENRDRLINKTIFLNTYVNPENGIANSHETFSASDYIEVESSVSYIFWWADTKENASVSSKAFYDADKRYISGEYSGNPITTPANCKYVRIDINNATSFNNLIMQKGSVKTEDIPNPKLDGIDVEVNSDNLSIEIENLAFVHEPTNKDVFTDKKIYLNTYINPENNYVGSHATMASSDYIAVKPNVTYVFSKLDGTITGFGNVIFYDENKEYISGQYSGSPLTTPSGCYFIRVSVNEVTTFDNVILQKGSAPSYPISKKMVTDFTVDVGHFNKKWVVVGDSITEKNFRSTTHYHDYIRAELGFNVVNMGVSGSGYKAREDTNNAFYQRISNTPTDADIITIMGGVNDAITSQPLGDVSDTETTTVCGCINKTIDNLYLTYPLARVGLITPVPADVYNPSNDTNPLALLSGKIVEIAKLRGIPCLDLYHTSGLRPWDATVNKTLFGTKESPNGDGLHPNALGHKFFYRKIMEFVKTI